MTLLGLQGHFLDNMSTQGSMFNLDLISVRHVRKLTLRDLETFIFTKTQLALRGHFLDNMSTQGSMFNLNLISVRRVSKLT